MFRSILSIFIIAGMVSTAVAERPPNVVFILADDLGYGDLGCYGCVDLATPNLDQLAEDGVRFTDFYANGAVCSPTRAAFVTGRYHHRIGMDNAIYYQEMGVGLPADGTTLATALRDAGYATGLSGKWHLGYDPERQPTQQGFGHFFGLLGGNHHYFDHMDRIGVPDLWLQDEEVERDGYSTDLFTDDAIDFLQSHRDRPFFLYLSHAAPHFPWQGPGDEDKDIQPKKKSWQEGDRQTYVAMVEHMDKGIGRVLAKLDALGLRDETLVVFTSDNGGHTYSRNAPLRDYKATLWEGGIRVPCIARWPGVLPAGEVTSQVAITMDWTATFRRLAGIPKDPQVEDGIDLLPILKGDTAPLERSLFWRNRKSPRRMRVIEGRVVRQGDWKLIDFVEGEDYLFNLKQDIGETTNLHDLQPDIVTELTAKLDNWEKNVAPASLD